MSQRIDTPTRAISRPESRPEGAEPPRSSATGAGSATDSGDARVGTMLAGRYQLMQRLGDGAMGSVYLAEHVALRRKVAVKILHAELSRLPEVVARFEREAVAAANIDHPNVAAAFDFGSLDDGTFFLALEYVEGRCLRDVMNGPLSTDRSVHVAAQIAQALERAHALGIVHRDLKPENIMLVERNGDPDFVKVLDFGIARMRMGEDEGTSGKAALTRAGMVYGTPEYMAPEQALGLPVDARADLYALGVITFEMLTGLRPFEAENTVILLGMQVTAPFPRFAERAPSVDVPPALEDIVYRLTAKSADARHGSAREVLDALDALDSQPRFEAPSGRVRINVAQVRPSRSSRPPPAPVDATGRTMFTASGEATDARFLLSTIQKILQRTWHEIQPLFHALWLKLPEKYRTRKVVLSVAGGAGGVLFLLFVWAIWPTSETLAVKEDAVVTGKTEPAKTPEVGANTALAHEAIKTGKLEEARKLIEEGHFNRPEETELRQALVRGFFTTNQRLDAFRQLEALYNVAPQSTEIAEIAVDVEKALIGADSSQVAFNYLESHPSHLGADVLYKIVAEAKASRPVLDRAHKALHNKLVRDHASPAVLVAFDLRVAGKSCKIVPPLVPRARDVGDKRALTYLYNIAAPTMVNVKTGIFKSKTVDALACLHKDDSINEAILAIEKRTGTPHREATTE